MITRRTILIALGSAAAVVPLGAIAQQPASLRRIGFLGAASASTIGARVQAFQSGLRELGYVEGKHTVIEFRWADGNYALLPRLAAELVGLKVAVIVAQGTPAISAAQQATTTIPIVMTGAGDPVRSGFVSSLSRPGGNITGLTNVSVAVRQKNLELLDAAVPKLSRVAVLVQPTLPLHAEYAKALQAYAKSTGVKIVAVEASTREHIEAAFDVIRRERAQALIVLADPFFIQQGRRIAELAVKNRVATLFPAREPVEAGGLMSYGYNVAEQYQRAAVYVDKILKGARPGDLPVEQPTKFELVINLKTAKAIGLKIPQELRLRADKVIE